MAGKIINKNSAGKEMQNLVEVMQKLREKKGCPWDRKQTHKTLIKYALEETYELFDAIESGNDNDIVEELGDILLQIVFHAQIASEQKRFDVADVIRGLVNKLVERHPHVFGNVKVKDAEEVIANWERIKLANGKKRTKDRFSGIPYILPALLTTFRIVEKSGKENFSQKEIEAKIRRASEKKLNPAELILNSALLLSLRKKNPEEILRKANRKIMLKLNLAEKKEEEKNESRSKKTSAR